MKDIRMRVMKAIVNEIKRMKLKRAQFYLKKTNEQENIFHA